MIDANPSKTFFIDILTRDISLTDCILDLIDNSIDSLVKEHDLKIMNTLLSGETENETKHLSKAEINISFTSSRFTIHDNCAGISIADAENEVFKFGSDKDDFKIESNGLSVYGIGMKRAIFKIGKSIKIESTTRTDNFKVDIDVDKWEKKKKWEFDFTETNHGNFDETGTTIEIKGINEELRKKLNLRSFQTELKSKIETTYSLFISNGLTITVNGEQAEAHLPQISHSEHLSPAVKKTNFQNVEILIINGLSSFEDKKTRGGWYIFCNGRMVLEADQTKTTGWGTGLPKFHSKYNHFVGFTYFQSNNVFRLPWKTSKDNIEPESEVYQFALNHMNALGKSVTTFLNKIYPSETSARDVIEKSVFEKAVSKSISELSNQDLSFNVNTDAIEIPTMVTISYSKPKEQVAEIAKRLGKSNMSYKEVGSRTFDYYYSMEIDA